MKPEESKYANYELEILAIIKALSKLRVYLLRIPFKIDTDCRTFALTMKEKNMHASSALDIGPRKNRIRKHQSGKSIVLVDTLSRNPISFRSRNRILNATAASNTEDIDIRWIYKLSETEKDNEYIIHGGVLFKKQGRDAPGKRILDSSSFGYIHSASEIIGGFKRHATVFGNSRRIVSDRGTAFTSRDFEEYCKGETIEHIRIATGTPRGYGQVRRVNRTLISLLTKLAYPKKEKWHRLQYLNVMQHRSNVPFKIFFGINAHLYENLEVRDFSEKERVADFQSDR
ncbi:hypothetical protein HZH68_016343 [Vespula germanica]|uniref:Integrase catalytic domain-containing protein n=1 Tax=Vespula germanica TaxID=30212 RepID=A0A834MRP0_VESGE|nr:hypothetical protein HZH68_016343 [Vespula germanica]